MKELIEKQAIKLTKTGTKTYEITGKSGNFAGYIQRAGTQKRGGWIVWLLSSPEETFETFVAAKREAIARAKKY